jgi:GNAT superfamily N-acetyltransferase
MIADPLSENIFFKKILLDDNFDSDYSLVAKEDNVVVGFIWSIVRKVPYADVGLEKNKGWIAALLVKKEYQRKGIGSALLEAVEKRMLNNGVKNIVLGSYTPNYLFPGVDKHNYPYARYFFEKNKYKKYGEAVSMERSLFSFKKTKKYLELSKRILKKGYKLSAFELSDAEELLDFLHINFPGDWAHNVKKAIIQDDAHDTILVLRDIDNNIVGYAQRAIDGNSDRFGPFGVKKSLRGQGLGAFLFNEMLFDMFSKGISHAYFLWTGGSAQKFYEKNGMNVYRSYDLILIP